MWHTPVSSVSPLKLTPRASSCARAASTSCTCSASGFGFAWCSRPIDRKSTRLNSSHTVIYTLSLHDALPIFAVEAHAARLQLRARRLHVLHVQRQRVRVRVVLQAHRSEEHTSELQSHSDLHSFPTRRSSDLRR